jgi:DNA helicase-2/ATP-dependent DNA helicase PcrA
LYKARFIWSARLFILFVGDEIDSVAPIGACDILHRMSKKIATPGDAFEKAYRALNKEQRSAVDAIEGPVVVIAGPGTGKTQVLTLRIANILWRTDARPENILAITFTDAGARAMRARLRTLIGAAADKVHIRTFHGLADELIKRYPDAYPEIVGGRLASEVERAKLIEEIILGGSVKLLRPTGRPDYYVKDIIGAIATLKKEDVSPAVLAVKLKAEEKMLSGMDKVHIKGVHKGKVRADYHAAERSLTKNRELLFVYQRYESNLRAARLYDFEDMILFTLAALLKNDDMLRDLQETYQYLLADEHQDVNASQNRLLELLASFHNNPNLFVVGDEKQAIYRFQGASLDNFLRFTSLYPKAKVIALTKNYRSAQAILDLSQAFVASEDPKLAKLRSPLVATTNETAVIERRRFSHEAFENHCLASAIKEELARGISPEEIAVIVRTNRAVEEITLLLRKVGIAAAASAESDILLHPLTARVRALIEAATAPTDEAALFSILHEPYWGISPADLWSAFSLRGDRESLLRLIEDEKGLKAAGVRDTRSFLRVATVLGEARRRGLVASPPRVLEYLLTESGLLEAALSEAPLESGPIIRRLYDEVEEMTRSGRATTLADVAHIFSLLCKHNLPLSVSFLPASAEAVRVMTAHKAKGLEFTTVFMPRVTDRAWGGNNRKSAFTMTFLKQTAATDAADDERRLFYVALTRAKRRLFLSTATTDINGRIGLAAEYFEIMDGRLAPERVVDAADFSPTAIITQVHSAGIDTALLTAALKRRGLSATALNNYLRSPWEYIYKNVLRVPVNKSPDLVFGSAVHEVLEHALWHQKRTGREPSDTETKRLLIRAFKRAALTKEEYARLFERAYDCLNAYLPHLFSSLPAHCEAEAKISATLATGLSEFPELTLNGLLDRIDIAESGDVLRVVDYKTGRRQSRREIEGKTKTNDGSYKRQLVFYILLLSLSDDKRYRRCRTATISFVEPDRHGAFKEETFTIADEEIEALRKLIVSVVKDIVSGACLASPRDDKKSPYCRLAEVLLRADVARKSYG